MLVGGPRERRVSVTEVLVSEDGKFGKSEKIELNPSTRFDVFVQTVATRLGLPYLPVLMNDSTRELLWDMAAVSRCRRLTAKEPNEEEQQLRSNKFLDDVRDHEAAANKKRQEFMKRFNRDKDEDEKEAKRIQEQLDKEMAERLAFGGDDDSPRPMHGRAGSRSPGSHSSGERGFHDAIDRLGRGDFGPGGFGDVDDMDVGDFSRGYRLMMERKAAAEAADRRVAAKQRAIEDRRKEEEARVAELAKRVADQERERQIRRDAALARRHQLMEDRGAEDDRLRQAQLRAQRLRMAAMGDSGVVTGPRRAGGDYKGDDDEDEDPFRDVMPRRSGPLARGRPGSGIDGGAGDGMGVELMPGYEELFEAMAFGTDRRRDPSAPAPRPGEAPDLFEYLARPFGNPAAPVAPARRDPAPMPVEPNAPRRSPIPIRRSPRPARSRSPRPVEAAAARRRSGRLAARSRSPAPERGQNAARARDPPRARGPVGRAAAAVRRVPRAVVQNAPVVRRVRRGRGAAGGRGAADGRGAAPGSPRPESGSQPATKKQLDNLLHSRYVDGGGVREECAICMAEFVYGDTVSRLPCLHPYHRECILEWFKRQSKCPTCQFVMPEA